MVAEVGVRDSILAGSGSLRSGPIRPFSGVYPVPRIPDLEFHALGQNWLEPWACFGAGDPRRRVSAGRTALNWPAAAFSCVPLNWPAAVFSPRASPLTWPAACPERSVLSSVEGSRGAILSPDPPSSGLRPSYPRVAGQYPLNCKRPRFPGTCRSGKPARAGDPGFVCQN